MRVTAESFFLNDPASAEICTLSLHDALPISRREHRALARAGARPRSRRPPRRHRRRHDARPPRPRAPAFRADARSEEHTSELQSRQYLVCRLLLEKTILFMTTALLATAAFIL